MSVTILWVIKYGQTLCFRWNHLCMWCIWSSSLCMCMYFTWFITSKKKERTRGHSGRVDSVFEIIKSTPKENKSRKYKLEWRPNSACDGLCIYLVSYQCKCSLRYGSLGPGTSGSVMTWKKAMEMEQWDAWKDWRDAWEWISLVKEVGTRVKKDLMSPPRIWTLGLVVTEEGKNSWPL